MRGFKTLVISEVQRERGGEGVLQAYVEERLRGVLEFESFKQKFKISVKCYLTLPVFQVFYADS